MNISILQLEHNDSHTKNERISHVLSQINALGKTDIIILPELWNTGFFSYDDYFNNSEAVDGETVTVLSDLAKSKCTYIFTGSFIEKRGGNFYNTACLLDRKGNIAAKYSKIHLFGDEKKYLSGGNEISVAKTDLGNIGLSICYDLRFPELYRKMVSDGAEIFLSCYALPHERTAHWNILTHARAIENQALFLSCGCAGLNNGVQYAGHSLAVSPTGKTIAVGREKHGDIITASADILDVHGYRADFPVLNDRIFND